jgi:hypothetical protein
MRRFGWYSAACALLIVAAIGIVATRTPSPSSRRWNPSSDELAIASASFAGSPFGSSGVSGSPSFSGPITLADGTFTSTKTTGNAFLFTSPSLGTTSSEFPFRVKSAGSDVFWLRGDLQAEFFGGIRITQTALVGFGSTWQLGASGLTASSSSTRTDVENTQANFTTMIRNNTGATGTGLVGGTSVADGTAGVEGATLLSWGTGVTTTGPAVSKFKITGAGPSLPQNAGTAGSGTGITTGRTAALQHYVHKITVARTALTAAATTQDVTIWTVPAKTRVLRMVEDVTAAFDDAAGPISAVTTTCGTSAGGAQYLASGSVFSVNTLGDVAAEIGAGLTSATVADIPSFSATTAIQCRWTSTGGNLSTLTTGSSDFYIEAVTYP